MQAAIAIVETVDEYTAAGGLVEAADHIHQRALAATGRSDNGNGFAAMDGQIDVVQNRLSRIVRKTQVLEFDPLDA